MSISSSIFQKACPACAGSVAVDAEQCQCGHRFDSEESQSPQEAALRDEELYEGYLVARVEQAQQTALAAEQKLMLAPADVDLNASAELAREVARSLESDLIAQRAKISALRRALPVKPIAKPIEKPVVKPAQAPKVAAVPREKTDARQTMVAVSTTPLLQEPVIKPTVTSKPPMQRASTAQKAADVLAALKRAKAEEAARKRTEQAMQAKVPTGPEDAMPASTSTISSNAPISTTVPPLAFRQDQAAKAEKIMETHKTTDSKDCPNCTAKVPVNTSRCYCGFAFISGSTELPSLTLCTGDFTALRESFKSNHQ